MDRIFKEFHNSDLQALFSLNFKLSLTLKNATAERRKDIIILCSINNYFVLFYKK